MKYKRHYLAACTLGDDTIYAFGGFYGSSDQEINDTIECFNVEANVWTLLPIKLKVSHNL
jgi:hypothetical protein